VPSIRTTAKANRRRAGRMTFKQYLGALAVVALVTSPVLAQEATDSAPAASSNSTPNPWAFSLVTSGYIVPDSQAYVSPDFSADRGWLHLEARYNNEALKTGSLLGRFQLQRRKETGAGCDPDGGRRLR
jgi:hypothetical protein